MGESSSIQVPPSCWYTFGMSRVIRYKAIAETLRRQIESGKLAAGQVLPSEAELSATHEASRVTIRKSLDELRSAGLVASRQGFGWFVAADPLQQSLEVLGTIEGQLAESDRSSEREVLSFAFVEAQGWVAEKLGEGTVLEVIRVNLVDGRPFGRVTVWCEERLGAGLSRSEVSSSTFHDLLPVTLGSAVQTIAAVAADASDAEILEIPTGSPVLVTHRVTCDADGKPVLASQHVFPGHLTEYVVDLPAASDTLSSQHLRLVEPG